MPYLVSLLAGGLLAAPGGRTKTLPSLKGFVLWEQSFTRYAPSPTPGNVRRTMALRFKNETREEIAEVDVRFHVHQGSRTTYVSPVFPVRVFDNVGVPHVGSLLPFNKSGMREAFTADYPSRLWNTGSRNEVEVVAVKVYDGPQDLHDVGHLFAWMANTKDDEIVRRLAKEPDLIRTKDARGVTATLVSFAVSGTGVQKYVLAHGGDLRSRSKGGATVAHFAAFNTNPGVLDLLRTKGVPTDVPSLTGRTPLFKAVEMGNPISLDWLLAHGANPNHVDKEDRTPVYYAIVEGQTHLFDALVRAGANPRRHNRNGYGWMHTAAAHNHLMLPHVLRTGVSVDDAAPRFGMTPLMVAARSGGYAAATWLLDHGANLDAKDVKGRTVYDYARESNTLRSDRFFREEVVARRR